MKKLLFGLIILIIACNSKTEKTNSNQSKAKIQSSTKEEILFPFEDTTFNWAGIEKKNDVVKLQFVKTAPTALSDEYDFYTNQSNYTNKKEFEQNCHVIDFNNDGVDDIIYTGSTGDEGNEVVVFLNTKEGFKKVLKQLQQITKLEFKNNKLFRLYIRDTGCCDAWVDFNRIYQIDYQNNIPQF